MFRNDEHERVNCLKIVQFCSFETLEFNREDKKSGG